MAKLDTTNARSETVGEKRSFSGPWKSGQFFLVPTTSFYEPNYESGPKSVRWKIWLKDEDKFAIAGLWRAWQGEAGGEVFSRAMLTINSDKHPLMSRFHAPGQGKADAETRKTLETLVGLRFAA
ncbi:SOS response-associated peptidase family protein [Cupriavidus sp. UME77]|uniref:SOS response-associated peptidase family protein n=1 Tax=Cupriavidus sp. UME77 TaxID=1862321 RepID=UPI00351C5CCE